MSSAYDPSGWHDFATTLAGATAALTGLVFVAMSIHLQALLADPLHRRRAEGTFVSLLVVLGAALLLLLPGLSRQAYGVICIAIALPLLRRAARSVSVLRLAGTSREPWITWTSAVIADLLLLTGGVGLLTRHAGGLYLVGVALLVMTARAMIVIWTLFVTLSQEQVGAESQTDGP